MSTWFTRNLGDPMLAGEPLDQIRTRFLSEFEKSGNSNDMAVFVRHESEGRLHCEVSVYFTPAAARVARALGAIPCNRPSSEGLGLLAGADDAWSILFQGTDNNMNKRT